MTPQPTTPIRSLKLLAGAMLLLVAVVFIFLIGNLVHQSQAPKATAKVAQDLPPASVSITAHGFVPATISIKAGQAVVWTDNDTSSHGIASGSNLNDTNLPGLTSNQHLAQGDTFSYVFAQPGTYNYHDPLHTYTFMGTVIVH